MYFRCQILINGISYEATDDLKNWDDFELAYKRSNYDGVLRSFSTKFELVNRSYSLLKEEFEQHYLSAKAAIAFYLRNNSWNWDKVFQCALDFSTYSDDGYVISINAIDNTLAAIINANKSIQYEYLVADLETRNLKYDRIDMINSVNWYVTGENVEGSADVKNQFAGATYNAIPLYYSEEEIFRNTKVKYSDIPGGDVQVRSGFIQAIEPVEVTLNINMSFITDTQESDNTRIVLFKNGVIFNDMKWYNNGSDLTNIDENIKVKLSLIGSSNIGDNLSLGIYSNKDIYNVTFKECKIKCSWSEKALPVGIDVISPQTILSKLLDSMTENTIEHEGVIDVTLPSSGGIDSIKFNRLLERTYIMAAESCRGLPKAKIYTSYKKFCEWMEADFGYVPVINENTVTLRHRDKLFSSTVVKDLGTGINDYEFSVNDSLIYSSVKVGYDKQDYDSINGRDEFHFTNEFSTGLKIADNTLSLISPYRADAYGIEFLVQKRGEDTTDSDSDNDVFFVDCVEDTSTGTLELNRPYSESQLSGLLSPDTIFNLNYSPRFMLEANKAYIGACTNMLKFTSSDGNSDVSIDGVKETDDFSIPERLFTVSEVEVETGDISAPDDLLGLVSLNNKGRIITGYIKQIKSYIGKAKSSSYTLIVKDIKSNQDGGTFV